MDNKKSFDARSLFRVPFLSLPTKFCTRIVMGALWGLALSEADLETRIALGAVLGVLVGLMSVSFFGWDRGRVDAARLALYGLYVAGEVLSVGAVIFGFLATFCGRLEPWAMMLCGVGGSLFTMYTMVQIYARNISDERGSSTSK
jgi:hypothetical protein